MKLTNDEIAKVFAMYWGNVSFKNGIGGHSVLSLTDCNDIGLGRISGKLLLSRLEDITDEDAIEVAKLLKLNPHDYILKEILGTYFNNRRIDEYPADVYLYILSKGYAVPLFFSVGHWENGKDAITLGIAIDKNKKGSI